MPADLSSKLIGGATKVKPMKWLRKQFKNNYSDALAWTTVGSIVAKDGVGCAMYVYQSKHNKKIPEERRRFVTATDLTNGGLMIVAQIALFLGMRKFSEPIFNKFFPKLSNSKVVNQLISRFRKMQKAAGEDPSRKLEALKNIKKYKNKGLDTFKFILDLSAATIIAKRIIVPFIAIPLASKVEKRMAAKDALKNGKPVDDNVEDKSNPTMKGAMKEFQTPSLDTGSTNLLAKYKK